MLLLMLLVYAVLRLARRGEAEGASRPADRAAVAMGLVLLLPATLHVVEPERFAAMIPATWPRPDLLILSRGVAELSVAVLLLVPRTRRLGGWLGVLLFLALWPAHLSAALNGQAGEDFVRSPLYLWLRVPFQLLYVGWAAWAALGHLPGLEIRRRSMALLYDRIMARYEVWIEPRRRALLSTVSGTVLELGPGTGANFAFLPPGVRWIGIEPNRHMHATLEARARACGIDAACLLVGAEHMEVADASVDVVLCTLVLCSVPDPRGVLADVRRVLKPGGRFLFLEHVAAPSGTFARRAQRLLRGPWQLCADGCTLDRETEAMIREAGFTGVDLERFEAPRDVTPAFVSRHVAGEARR